MTKKPPATRYSDGRRLLGGVCVLLFGLVSACSAASEPETFPPLAGEPPQSFAALWRDFDPRAEPLETEILHRQQVDGIEVQVVRFRVGRFKGQIARVAGVFARPAGDAAVPGLLQIHGGGQYADAAACVTNAKRGYATLSLAWAGRINAPGYRVSPAEVKLFWADRTDDPRYRVTTDWASLDGYHAPARNRGNAFPSIQPATWTLDAVESPRNSGWFLAAVAARRGLTFLERQRGVDGERLGVYGHSMGGKLTVMTASDDRVKAAAPSCGGISDRTNDRALFRATLGDDAALPHITCPTIFLSPANDFHGRLGDLPKALSEIATDQWRLVCSPHHNHQDTAEYEVATQLWMDRHLRGGSPLPSTPTTSWTTDEQGQLVLEVRPDTRGGRTPGGEIVDVEVYATQQGRPAERPEDRERTVHRFWRDCPTNANTARTRWTAPLPLADDVRPLWVLANVRYRLATAVSGAGYYYRPYTTQEFVLSAVPVMIPPGLLAESATVRPVEPSQVIDDFGPRWQREWFAYREGWARTTNKLNDPSYAAPPGSQLELTVQSREANELVVRLDEFAVARTLPGGTAPVVLHFSPRDFADVAGKPLASWDAIRQLELAPLVRLRAGRGETAAPRTLGKPWRGPEPRFLRLRWVEPERPTS